MSGNFGSNLGPHWATWAPTWAHVGLCGAPWNSRGRKKKKQHKTFPLGFFLSLFCGYVSPMLGNLGSHMGWCQGTLGLTWAHIRGLGVQLGPMLAIWWFMLASIEVSGRKKIPPTQNCTMFDMVLKCFWMVLLCFDTPGPWHCWTHLNPPHNKTIQTQLMRNMRSSHNFSHPAWFPSFPIMFSNRSGPNLFYFSTGPPLV